jgi:hypothetical protein
MAVMKKILITKLYGFPERLMLSVSKKKTLLVLKNMINLLITCTGTMMIKKCKN